ncbi:MAG: hypothetical protein NZ473_06855 [Candidatus Kapabacteria bacterium]|nr:hypothetical protein [Candidatus Kapabacteria bacterium]MDW8225324.1 hypothetical protein [Bacteroidota bacterium]
MWWIFLAFLGLLSIPSTAQWIRASGSLGASADMYRTFGSSTRLPSQSYRAIARFTVHLFDQVDLPFEVYLNSGRIGYLQPFNQFGVTPRIGNWLQLFGGWYSTRISDYTFGDQRILGGGVELTPGNLRLAFHYGYTRQARNPDTAYRFYGEYRRRIIIGKLGYETPGGAFLTLQAMTSRDEAGSIRRDSLTPTPQANAVFSIAGGAGVLEGTVRFRGELAFSLFTNNTGAEPDSAGILNLPSFTQRLLPINTTSHIDGAARVNLAVTPSPLWGITLDGQWIGPGFVTLGFTQLFNDVLDLGASPYVRLFNGRLLVRATVSRRTNNLRQTRIATTERWTTTGGISWQLTDALSLDVQAAQYTMSSDHANDTLRADNRTRTLTLTPSWRFRAWGADQFLSAAVTYQHASDRNILSGRYGTSSALSASLSHSLQFRSKLNLNTSLNVSRTDTYFQDITFATLSESLTYPFAERLALRASLSFGMTSAALTAFQLSLRSGLTYSLEEWGSFTLYLTSNTYDLTARHGNRYTELFGSLQYSVNF